MLLVTSSMDRPICTVLAGHGERNRMHHCWSLISELNISALARAGPRSTIQLSKDHS